MRIEQGGMFSGEKGSEKSGVEEIKKPEVAAAVEAPVFDQPLEHAQVEAANSDAAKVEQLKNGASEKEMEKNKASVQEIRSAGNAFKSAVQFAEDIAGMKSGFTSGVPADFERKKTELLQTIERAYQSFYKNSSDTRLGIPGLENVLDKIKAASKPESIKQEMHQLMQNLPNVGETLEMVANTMEQKIKNTGNSKEAILELRSVANQFRFSMQNIENIGSMKSGIFSGVPIEFGNQRDQLVMTVKKAHEALRNNSDGLSFGFPGISGMIEKISNAKSPSEIKNEIAELKISIPKVSGLLEMTADALDNKMKN